jgi:hypothetical protein
MPPGLLTETARVSPIEKELMSALEAVPRRPGSLVRGYHSISAPQQAIEASHQSKYALVPC